MVAALLLLVQQSTGTFAGESDQSDGPIRDWCAAWGQAKCAKLIWDLDLPSYDVVSGGWQAGRLIGSYSARWPDGFVIDLSDSAVRPPFEPADLDTSESLRRIRTSIHRQIRQPDGSSLAVTVNMMTRGGMLLGSLPSLAERPDPLVESNPPVVAWWVETRLNSPGSIAVVKSEPDFVEFELLELKAAAEIRRSSGDVSGWYLSKLNRFGADGKPWWSAEFTKPKLFGRAGQILGTIRKVHVQTEEHTVGSAVVSAAPQSRTDYLLGAEISQSCPDKDFTQSLEGMSLASVASPPSPQVEALAQKRIAEAIGGKPGNPVGSQRQQAAKLNSLGKWWILIIAGCVFLVAGIVLAVRKNS